MMRSGSYKIPLMAGSENVIDFIELSTFDNGSIVDISVTSGPLKGEKFSGVDYFWVLSHIRLRLEEMGYRMACQGTRKHVFPGGMLGETSMGMVAYEFDRDGNISGRVNIFDHIKEGEVVDIVNFHDQRNFRSGQIRNKKIRDLF